jgi:hypothetical protein
MRHARQENEELWREIFDAEDKDGISYCLEQGVDVVGDDGEPVGGWRDIAVMLKAIELGIVELADKPESGAKP